MTQANRFDFTQDAIAQTQARLIELLQEANGPDVTIEIVTRRTIAPSPAAQRPLLTMLGDEVFLADAARVVGLSTRTLRRYAEQGRFRLAERAGHRLVMQKADVERLAALTEHRSPGRRR